MPPFDPPGAEIDLDRLALKTKLEEDFYFFVRYGYRQMTGMRWIRSWHHEILCRKLEAVYRGECKRLIVNMPPRYSKTEIIVKYFMAWCLARQPDCEFIHASYSARLAASNTAYVRSLVTSEWFQSIFCARIDPATSGKDNWRTNAGGAVYASGAYGTITGFGAGKMRPDGNPAFGGAILIDDPHKPDEALSDKVRKNVHAWYANTMQSRVNDPNNTPIIIVMQRLHEDDLTGWLLKGGSGDAWEHLKIPALNEAESRALWPAKHSVAQLLRMREATSYVFAGQYQQEPTPVGGGIFKEDWWRYYRTPPARFKRIIQSWDTAFKKKQENDPSSCTTWGEADNGYYLLDRLNKRMEFPELKRTAINLFIRWNPNAVLVEDKASGQSLIQELRQPVEHEGRRFRLPIVPIKVDSDKVTRAFAVTALVESGQVFVPEVAPWVTEYIHQLGAFPGSEHDDDVDSTTQALNYFHSASAKRGLLDYMREQAVAQEEQEKAVT